jgi:hypothetical protein
MKKFENFYLSKDQWEKLQNYVTKKKEIQEERKQIAAARIKKSLRAIKLSLKRLIKLNSFNELLKKHNLKQQSYSRETISKLLNEIETVSDRDFIEWIKIFMSFFYTELCIFMIPKEHTDKIPKDFNFDPEDFDFEDFNVALQDYCRQWEDRKDKMKKFDLKMEQFEDQNLTNDKKKAIIGRWKGDAVQEFSDGRKMLAKVDGELEMKKDDTIRGELKYSFELNGEKFTDTIRLYGRFLYASFLRLNYENSDDFITQFGAVVLKLDATGSFLDGNFIGFGRRTEELFKADVHLKKVFVD